MRKTIFSFILLFFCINTQFQKEFVQAQAGDSLQLLYSTGSAGRLSRSLSGIGNLALLDITTGSTLVERHFRNDAYNSVPISCSAFSADGRFLLYSLVSPVHLETTLDPQGNVAQSFVLDLETNFEWAVTEMSLVGGASFCPRWSKQGNLLFITNMVYNDSEPSLEFLIAVYDVEQQRFLYETDIPARDASPNMWSPDGSQLVYVALEEEHEDDFGHILNLETYEVVARIPDVNHFIGWTSDSAFMAFTSYFMNSSTLNLHIQPRVSLTETNITVPLGDPINQNSVGYAEWSPVNHKIAFYEMADESPMSNLYIYDVDTETRTLVAESHRDVAYLQWSHDERYLLFSPATGHYSIYDIESQSILNLPGLGRASFSPTEPYLLYEVPIDFYAAMTDSVEPDNYEWILYDLSQAMIIGEYTFPFDDDTELGLSRGVWHPDGRYVALARGALILDIEENRFIEMEHDAQNLLWRPQSQ